MTGVPCQGHRPELFEVGRNPGSAALSAPQRNRMLMPGGNRGTVAPFGMALSNGVWVTIGY